MIIPDYTNNSLYSLSCTIAELLGVSRNCNCNKLNIGGKKLVLILIDGLGWNLFEKLGIEFKEVIKAHTVFPSTTSTALTTLFTALTPIEHGVLGYITYSKILGSVINTLKYIHPSENGRDSLKDGIPFSKAFPKAKGYLHEVKDKKTISIIPKGIENSEFSNHVHKTNETKTYVNIWDAFHQFTNVLNDGSFDFLYLYIPDVDTLAHLYGPNSEPVLISSKYIISIIYEKVRKYSGKFTFIVTSDHGHFEVDKINYFNDKHELINLLDIPPYGDSRAIFLRSRYDLKTYINREFPNLKVFNRLEILQTRLLGNDKETEYLPDYIAVPLDNQAYVYKYKDREEQIKLKGSHSGLSAYEIEIPLVIIDG
jgi:predicted AlkP superfamily pyrophosphatase or phosphodiesterase